jgi:hypothetical protein
MPDALFIALVFLAFAAVGAVLARPLAHRVHAPAAFPAGSPGATSAVGIGTVRTVADPITVDVESVSGQRFVGRLRRGDGEPGMSDLRPGVVLLVAFDPAAREQLSLADDMVAVRSEFDQMLVRKGLATRGQLELIRHGTRSRCPRGLPRGRTRPDGQQTGGWAVPGARDRADSRVGAG